MIREDFDQVDVHRTQYESSFEPPLYPPVYEPPRGPGPVLASAARYWYLLLLPALLLAGAAVAIGLERKPVYKAETRLNVGGFNISPLSLPGYYGGATTLAVAYSRAAYAHTVIGPVARQEGKTEDELAGMINASPVKDSPIIRIEVESKNPREAVRIANRTAPRLQRYAVKLARSNPDVPRLLQQYKRVSRDFAAALQRQQRAHRARKHVESADTAVEIAKLRKVSVSGLYHAALGGQATTNAVQWLNPAHHAKSDRDKVLQRLVVGAVLGGLAIGLALAYLVGRRRLPSRMT